jgi:hypothetical protein
MPGNPSCVLDFAVAIDQQIEDAQREIRKQEKIIMSLASDGHEVTDATRRLGDLLATFTALVQMKMRAM